MSVKDPDIFRIVEKISSHYLNNISNRFMRKALLVLEIQQSDWERLDSLTAGLEYHRAQGYQFDELYEMILSAARFIAQARQRILPNLRAMASQGTVLGRRAGEAAGGDQDRILRDMATQNFPVNLGILTDLVNELYLKTTALDRKAAGKKTPVFQRIPELKDLGRYLVSS